jgi:hypothetical protein
MLIRRLFNTAVITQSKKVKCFAVLNLCVSIDIETRKFSYFKKDKREKREKRDKRDKIDMRDKRDK